MRFGPPPDLDFQIFYYGPVRWSSGNSCDFNLCFHILFSFADTVNAIIKNLKNARTINCAKLSMIVEMALAIETVLAYCILNCHL